MRSLTAPLILEKLVNCPSFVDIVRYLSTKLQLSGQKSHEYKYSVLAVARDFATGMS